MRTHSTLQTYLCYMMRQISSNTYSDDCDNYSIRKFRALPVLTKLKEFMEDCSLCQSHWLFPTYWIAVMVAAWAMIYGYVEFFRIWLHPEKPVSMWRTRCYYVLTDACIRKFRLIGAFFMSQSWLLLFYALISITPSLMTPWIIIHLCILIFELITSVTEVFLGGRFITLNVLIQISFAALFLGCVRCVQHLIQEAIDLDATQELYVFNYGK